MEWWDSEKRADGCRMIGASWIDDTPDRVRAIGLWRHRHQASAEMD